MKKILILVLIYLFLFSGLSFSETDTEEEPLHGPFGIETPIYFGVGFGGLMGMYNFSTGDAEVDKQLELIAGLATLRFGGFLTGGYKFSDLLSAGCEIGFYNVSIFSQSEGSSISPLDFTIRGVVRLDWGILFAQPHLGFYGMIPDFIGAIYAALDPDLPIEDALLGSYFDIGSKVGLLIGPVQVYAELGYLIGQVSHLRVGGGFALIFR
jgi:hypothetical protein